MNILKSLCLFFSLSLYAADLPLSKELYSLPDWSDEKSEAGLKRVVLIGANDWNGHLGAQVEEVGPKNGHKAQIQVGGKVVTRAYIDILKKRFGDGWLFLNSGNFFPESSDPKRWQETIQFINGFSHSVLGLGVKDLQLLKTYQQNKGPRIQIPLVASNLLDLATGEMPKIEALKSHVLKTVNGVRVGILSTLGPKALANVDKENIKGLYIDNMAKTILKKSKELRHLGAQVIVLLASSEINCGEFNGEDSWKNFSHLDPWKLNCNAADELFLITQKIGMGAVDAIFISHSPPALISQFINGIPVLSLGDNGKYLGRLDLFYHSSERRLHTDKTRIFTPIKLCHKFFSKVNDCVGQGAEADLTKLEAARFLGYEIPEENASLKTTREISSRKN